MNQRISESVSVGSKRKVLPIHPRPFQWDLSWTDGEGEQGEKIQVENPQALRILKRILAEESVKEIQITRRQ